LEVYSPSHMVAVPKIWDTIKKGLLSKVATSSAIAQCLVHTAIKWRTFAVKVGLDTPFFNAIVFKKFKQAVGGNLRFALSGGGPLNGEVQEFIRVAFDVPLIQGYVSLFLVGLIVGLFSMGAFLIFWILDCSGAD
jgi:long-chain acyl-CoA synthetase